MPKKNPAVDAYIAKAPEQARPILKKIREGFHAGCPELEERIKWGVPSFDYQGMLGGMAAFKHHVAFGFWKARLMRDDQKLFSRGARASVMAVRARSLADLPPKKTLVAYVKQAKQLNEDGVRAPRRAKKAPAKLALPKDFSQALAKNAKARATFEALPPSHKREYVSWIDEAKRAETRARRLATALEWLSGGKRWNWKYEEKSAKKPRPAR